MQALSYKALKRFKGFEHKKCLFCGSKQVKKNGVRNGLQRYKCLACGRQFDSGRRPNPQTLWQAYTSGKQTAAQLAQIHGCSRQTILRHLKKAAPKAQFAAPSKANVIMDTTCFGRTFGVMVLFDNISR
ncbi:transposase [Neisseria bacilliformis]|uniref:transposase n=1 Tax=Neisseria bacilliformis TaxID=267212 RepID=UPI003BEEC76F